MYKFQKSMGSEDAKVGLIGKLLNFIKAGFDLFNYRPTLLNINIKLSSPE